MASRAENFTSSWKTRDNFEYSGSENNMIREDGIAIMLYSTQGFWYGFTISVANPETLLLILDVLFHVVVFLSSTCLWPEYVPAQSKDLVTQLANRSAVLITFFHDRPASGGGHKIASQYWEFLNS